MKSPFNKAVQSLCCAARGETGVTQSVHFCFFCQFQSYLSHENDVFLFPYITFLSLNKKAPFCQFNWKTFFESAP